MSLFKSIPVEKMVKKKRSWESRLKTHMMVLVKSGVSPADCPNVCKHIVENCPQLILSGLMTIGMFGRDPSEENPDFQVRL